jgi:hypothetical protein
MPNTPSLHPNPLWALVSILVVLAVICVALISSRRQAALRSAELRRRFGAEYERTVRQYGSPARAERELAARAQRVKHFRFRELSEVDRARFAARWSSIQARFVDDPLGAVADANDLISEVMAVRGYPSRGFEQRVADLSVHHAAVVQHYRAADGLTQPTGTPERDTENLRQAVVHYRALFAELLQENEAEASGAFSRATRGGLRA